MGMCLGLVTLSDANIERVIADPPLAWRVIAPDDPEPYERARKEFGGGGGLLARIFGGRNKNAAAVEPPDLELAAGEGENTDLDKAWHGIHYLLTQTEAGGEGPLASLLCGGREVVGVDVGYGPPRVLKAEEVKALHQALDPLDDEFLRSRFNPTEMKRLQIYPDIWDRDADDDPLGYCVEYFGVLKNFTAEAAQKQMGILIYLS